MDSITTKHGYRITNVLHGRSNVFLVSHRGHHLLIDACWRFERAKLLRHLGKLGVRALDAIILTHTHFDHADNAAFIREHFGTKVIVSAKEANLLEAGEQVFPIGTTPLARLVLAGVKPFAERGVSCHPCQVDVRVDGTLELSDYGFDARIISTPGHTPGSQSVIIDSEIALVGDAMFGIMPGTIFPPFAEDIPELIKSWKKLLDTGCRLFLPSHGTVNTRALVEKCYGRRT